MRGTLNGVRLYLGVLIAVAGCIEPDLDTCLQLTCPPAATCEVIGGKPRCAVANSACAGADGTSCGDHGICAVGMCVGVVCGDGNVDAPLEECDDANLAGGDGCSELCVVERCGNNVTDPDESCDCGDVGTTPRPECGGHNNSDDDGLAPCRANCALRSCGDGVLDPSEQCEGADLGDQSCGSIGFYPDAANALACTPFCRFDVSGCTGGRCGDAVINGSEPCDGTTFASGVTCALSGYYDTDTADNRCTPFCTFDTSACVHRCGDGVLDPLHEQCDGNDIGTRTCADFGKIRGGLKCTSFCAYDTSMCDGSCGDDVVDQGEYCDGNQPAGSCLDFGFSAGELGCSNLCGPALSNCLPPTVWTDVAAGRHDFKDIMPGPVGTAWLISPTDVVLWSTTGVTSAPVTGVSDGHGVGGLLAVATSAGPIYRYRRGTDGMPELYDTITGGPVCTQIVMTSATTLACLYGNHARWYIDGVGWGSELTGPSLGTPIDAQADGANAVYSDYNGQGSGGGVFRVTANAIAAMTGATSYVEQINALPDGLYGGVEYSGGQTGYPGYDTTYVPTGGTDWSPLPADGRFSPGDAGGLKLWIDRNMFQPVIEVADAGIRKTRAIDPLTNLLCKRIVTTGRTALCLRDSGAVARFAGATSGQREDTGAIPQGSVLDAYIDENERSYILGGGSATSSWPLDLPEFAISDGMSYDALIGAKGAGIVMIGVPTGGTSRRQLAYWDGGAFTYGTTATEIAAAAPAGNGTVIAALGSASCTIWSGPVDALVQQAGPAITCPSSFWVSPSGTIWSVSTSEVRNLTQSSVGALTFPASVATKAAIHGVDNSHIWAVVAESIWFWNGTTWTEQLVLPGGAFDWVYAASATRVIATSGAATWMLGSSGTWQRLRLPSDPTPLVHPILTSWGVFFRTPSGSLLYSAWQNNWP